MKSFFTLILAFSVACSATAQSKSFLTLKERFHGYAETYSFSTSGFVARTVLRLAGEDEYIRAFRDVRNVRLMVIPKSAFRREHLTVDGFVKFTRQDGYEELGRVRDHGDNVTLLLQTPKKSSDNRYLVLVDDNDEVVAIEVKGYIDPEILLNPDQKKLAYSR